MKYKLLISLLLIVSACTKNDVPSSEDGIQDFSIFVATDRHDIGQGNNLKALVQLASQKRGAHIPEVYLIGGDNVGTGAGNDSLAMPPYSLSEVRSEIAAGLGSDNFTFLPTFGSHDGGCTTPYTDFFSGPRSCNGVYVYGVSYAQMCFAADTSATSYTALDAFDSFGVSATTASAGFLRWVNSLEDTDPIVVMSHMPIHGNRGDNPGGKIWADALNEASLGHDIFLLFGHNHTMEGTTLAPMEPQQEGGDQPLDSLGYAEGGDIGGGDPQQGGQQGVRVNEQDYYLVLPGNRLPVQTADRNVVDTICIRFTYMNAGYLKMGYASTISFSDENSDGVFDRFGIRRFTVNDTTITHFGSTSIPNPLIMDSWHPSEKMR